MTQSQVLDLLDLMREQRDMMREMVALQKQILERLEQPAPAAAQGRWKDWDEWTRDGGTIPGIVTEVTSK